jgi:hypothetical protein
MGLATLGKSTATATASTSTSTQLSGASTTAATT